MNYSEKTISSKRIFDGKVIKLKVDKVLLPNGKIGTRELVEHNGGVGVVAVLDNKIIMVRQFRKALEESIFEIPAGKIEGNEEPYICAARELQEETGFIPDNLELLNCIYTTPGFTNEKLHIFYSDKLKTGIPNCDEDEFLDVVTFEVEEALEMIRNGTIRDGKSICGILMYVQYIRHLEKNN